MGRPNKIEKRTSEHQCILPPGRSYPWLLYFSTNYKHHTQLTFCNILDPNKTYSRSIPELRDVSLLTVQHGWCLLMKGVTKPFLWNPSNLEKVDLPRLKRNIAICNCIFSCPPTATDQVCFVFLFPHYSQMDSKILYCQLGDEQWTEVNYTSEEASDFLVNPVYCNGCLYAEFYFSKVLVVIEKVEPRGFEIISAHVLLPPPPNSFEGKRWLLESNNELFHIRITFEGCVIISVAVYKLDFCSMEWVRVKTIKDKVFFLSHNNLPDLPFACQAINPETGGRIYLTLENNKFVYMYNVEDNTLVICQAFSNLPTKLHRSLWFRPDLRMTFSLKEGREKTETRGGKGSVAFHSNKTGDIATNSCAFPLEAFPSEIIGEVAKNLNVLDYLHLRATSHFFRSIVPPFQWSWSFSHTSMSSFDDLSLSPLFVFFEKENVLTFVHPKHGNKYKYSINFPEDIQGDCEICYSKDGWLLLAVNTISNMFFNPFTKEVKQLACGPAPEETVKNTVGISHPPTSSECVVVELQKVSSVMIINITGLGEETWEEFEFEDSNFCLSKISPCFHNGAFYYLSSKGKLGILKEVGDDKIWKECKKPHAPCAGYYKCFLVEHNGSLLSIFEGSRNWVSIFKLNESEMIWTRVENLGNYMLFVGDQSFSAVANISGMENKIYFPRFYGENIIFYSLETRNYHTFESFEVVDFHCMSEPFNSSSSWIQPRWRELSK